MHGGRGAKKLLQSPNASVSHKHTVSPAPTLLQASGDPCRVLTLTAPQSCRWCGDVSSKSVVLGRAGANSAETLQPARSHTPGCATDNDFCWRPLTPTDLVRPLRPPSIVQPVRRDLLREICSSAYPRSRLRSVPSFPGLMTSISDVSVHSLHLSRNSSIV